MVLLAFRRLVASRGWWLLGSAALVVVVALLRISLFRQQPQYTVAQPVQVNTSATNLGIAYVTLNPRLSAYYQLQVSTGALVTDVAANSPAEKAGIRSGEVILSFNGARVEERAPLLGMMRNCMAGNTISMEVWDGRSTRVIELFHVE